MKKRLSEIERSRIDDRRIYGLVVKETDSLVLIHRVVDFLFDGILVIRQKDITDRINGSSRELRYENIMRAEGLWKTAGRFVNNLPILDWKELLDALIGKPVLIENETNSSCWIGVVEICGEKKVSLRCFDSLGVPDNDLTQVPYRNITAAQFGDRYTQLQSKYKAGFSTVSVR